jgi:hypothetical protein
MSATGYAEPGTFFGTSVPTVWSLQPRRVLFGDVVVVAFLLTQCFDGIFTYIGVTTFGPGIEANPLIGALMLHLGHGPALLTAKAMSASLGIALHLRRIHGAVALLAGFYLSAAILPWIAILFF